MSRSCELQPLSLRRHYNSITALSAASCFTPPLSSRNPTRMNPHEILTINSQRAIARFLPCLFPFFFHSFKLTSPHLLLPRRSSFATINTKNIQLFPSSIRKGSPTGFRRGSRWKPCLGARPTTPRRATVAPHPPSSAAAPACAVTATFPLPSISSNMPLSALLHPPLGVSPLRPTLAVLSPPVPSPTARARAALRHPSRFLSRVLPAADVRPSAAPHMPNASPPPQTPTAASTAETHPQPACPRTARAAGPSPTSPAPVATPPPS
ncbi:hypothetical protein LY78DRAFT_349260 [Colletotrichum sublineola]|nr:hypothetical protein LY78DRAFT_349260 [Colletotrichum sublineola]